MTPPRKPCRACIIAMAVANLLKLAMLFSCIVFLTLLVLER